VIAQVGGAPLEEILPPVTGADPPRGRRLTSRSPMGIEAAGLSDRVEAVSGDALPEGGAYIVIENVIDDARRENAFGLLMSLNMLIEFGDAFDFTGADFAAWCKEAGFTEVDVLPLAGPTSAGIAYK
jgi:hypothetical protein